MFPYRIRRNRTPLDQYLLAREELDMALYLWKHAGKPHELRPVVHRLAQRYLEAKQAVELFLG